MTPPVYHYRHRQESEVPSTPRETEGQVFDLETGEPISVEEMFTRSHQRLEQVTTPAPLDYSNRAVQNPGQLVFSLTGSKFITIEEMFLLAQDRLDHMRE